MSTEVPATEPSQVTIDMKEQTAETKEAAPVASAAVQTPANLTAPEEPKKAETPKKAEEEYSDYSYSDEEGEHDGIIPTTEFDMKELAKTEHLNEVECGKDPQTLYCPGCKKNVTSVLKEKPWVFIVWLWVAIVIICVILAFAETSPIAAIIFVVVFGLVVSIPYGLKVKPAHKCPECKRTLGRVGKKAWIQNTQATA